MRAVWKIARHFLKKLKIESPAMIQQGLSKHPKKRKLLGHRDIYTPTDMVALLTESLEQTQVTHLFIN